MLNKLIAKFRTYKKGELLKDGDVLLFCFLCLCDDDTGDGFFSATVTSYLYLDL